MYWVSAQAIESPPWSLWTAVSAIQQHWITVNSCIVLYFFCRVYCHCRSRLRLYLCRRFYCYCRFAFMFCFIEVQIGSETYSSVRLLSSIKAHSWNGSTSDGATNRYVTSCSQTTFSGVLRDWRRQVDPSTKTIKKLYHPLHSQGRLLAVACSTRLLCLFIP